MISFFSSEIERKSAMEKVQSIQGIETYGVIVTSIGTSILNQTVKFAGIRMTERSVV